MNSERWAVRKARWSQWAAKESGMELSIEWQPLWTIAIIAIGGGMELADRIDGADRFTRESFAILIAVYLSPYVIGGCWLGVSACWRIWYRSRFVPQRLLLRLCDSNDPYSVLKAVENNHASVEVLDAAARRVVWEQELGLNETSLIQHRIVTHPHVTDGVLAVAAGRAVDSQILAEVAKSSRAEEATRVMAALRMEPGLSESKRRAYVTWGTELTPVAIQRRILHATQQ